MPEKITLDKSGTNTAAIKRVCDDACIDIKLRQSKYLNNIVEQDHRAVKRITRPCLASSHFGARALSCVGIEIMHMIKKGQLDCPDGQTASAAQQFYSLAF